MTAAKGPRESRACTVCGLMFQPMRRNGPAPKRCPDCSRRFGRFPVIQKSCSVCGASFLGRSQVRTCSRACSLKGRRSPFRQPMRRMTITAIEARCVQCGADFRYEKWNGRLRKFCSRQCSNKHHWRYRYGRTAKRRLRILERDHWKCQICGQRIPKRVRPGTPRYGTVDHLLPIIAHGSEAPTNLRAAHLSCNSRRGCRGPAQLVLIGNIRAGGNSR